MKLSNSANLRNTIISIHPRKYSGDDQIKRFVNSKPISTLARLAKIVADGWAWSPAIYSGQIKNQTNWIGADYLALDFDDGELTLDAAVKTFCDMACVIGTTMSHQKEKRGRICDRYRVILRLEEFCENFVDYEYTAYKLINHYGSDPTCGDPAKFYKPCREIVFVGDDDGFHQDILAKPRWLTFKKNISNELRIRHYAETGELPDYVTAFLKRGEIYRDGRNSTIFAVAAFLFDCGVSSAKVIQMIGQSPFSREGLRHNEIENAIGSAYRRVSKKRGQGL